MGYAIASAAAAQGADVVLVSGPVNLGRPPGVTVIGVESAEDMYRATHDAITGTDVFVAAAAVADYRPVAVAEQKIKKKDTEMSLELTRCPDILASVAALEGAPFTVGFAAETENLVIHARGKLRNKNLDMIIANRVGNGHGFDRDDNAAFVMWNDGERSFSTSSKDALAHNLIELVAERFYAARGSKKKPGLTVITNN